jgi:putative endonuclease
MVYLYILQSLVDNGFYTGITKDITQRLAKHNAGRVSSTKNRRPFKIVHVEVFEGYKTARLREIEIKSYKGGNSFKQLVKS